MFLLNRASQMRSSIRGAREHHREHTALGLACAAVNIAADPGNSTYYDFPDIDVDRYMIGGKSQAVMLAARELSLSKLPAGSQNWVNERLIYTHGYGVTMSTVSRFTKEGLPESLPVQHAGGKLTAGYPGKTPRNLLRRTHGLARLRQDKTKGIQLSRGRSEQLYRIRRNRRHPDGFASAAVAHRMVGRRFS